MKRIYGAIYFSASFFFAFIQANLAVAWIILFVNKKELRPFFFDYDVKELTEREALFLSHCITLTPGTISVSFSKEHNSLKIHVLSAASKEQAKEEIDRQLKKPLLAMTRGI